MKIQWRMVNMKIHSSACYTRRFSKAQWYTSKSTIVLDIHWDPLMHETYQILTQVCKISRSTGAWYMYIHKVQLQRLIYIKFHSSALYRKIPMPFIYKIHWPFIYKIHWTFIFIYNNIHWPFTYKIHWPFTYKIHWPFPLALYKQEDPLALYIKKIPWRVLV